MQKVLDSWSQRGVHSHFHGYMPAALSDLPAKKPMAKLVGTKENNVAILNGLTVNLHLLLATFFRPTEKRFKILIEEHAFPSDTVSGPVGVRKDRKELALVFLLLAAVQSSAAEACLMSVVITTN